MHQLPALAFKYHATLASLRAFRGVSKGLLAGTAAAGGLFLVLLYRLVLTTAQAHGMTQYLLLVMNMITEMLLLLLVYRVQHGRDAETVRQINALIHPAAPTTTIHGARTALLSHLFGRPPTAFLATAENIRQYLDLTRPADRPFSFRAETLINFIFNPEARTRTVSLLLAVATLITALTLFDSDVRTTALEIVIALKPQWVGLWLTGVVALTGAAFVVTVLFSLGRVLSEIASRWSSAEHEMNPALIRYLVRDLAIYHVWREITPETVSKQVELVPETPVEVILIPGH